MNKMKKENLKLSWAAIQKERDEIYLVKLKSLDRNGEGVELSCPECNSSFWARLPEKRYSYDGSIFITCPTTCGALYPIDSFSPVVTSKTVKTYDITTICKSDGTEFSVNGAVCRCPVCGVENSREVMRNLLNSIRGKCERVTTREELIDMLNQVVSTFDGVMRRCNIIVVQNREKYKDERYKNNQHPKVNSFQNLTAARDKLVPDFDMALYVSDWPVLVRTFQKRHLFAHSLGVVDSAYLNKTNDPSAIKCLILSFRVTLETDISNGWNHVKAFRCSPY